MTFTIEEHSDDPKLTPEQWTEVMEELDGRIENFIDAIYPDIIADILENEYGVHYSVHQEKETTQ